LYGKRELLLQMHPFQGGGDMIKTVDFEHTTYNELPLKFEAGTPMIAQVIGLGTALDYLTSIGMEHIAAWELELLAYASDKLARLPGLTIIGTAREKCAIISFKVQGVHPLDIGTLLDLKGIAIRTGHHCAQPLMARYSIPAAARVSFAFYNTKAEIDYFIEALAEIIALLRGE
jgi:cysteine desulfurase/selenocysteine lyase